MEQKVEQLEHMFKIIVCLPMFILFVQLKHIVFRFDYVDFFFHAISLFCNFFYLIIEHEKLKICLSTSKKKLLVHVHSVSNWSILYWNLILPFLWNFIILHFFDSWTTERWELIFFYKTLSICFLVHLYYLFIFETRHSRLPQASERCFRKTSNFGHHSAVSISQSS